jgi:hypothetical protein
MKSFATVHGMETSDDVRPPQHREFRGPLAGLVGGRFRL